MRLLAASALLGALAGAALVPPLQGRVGGGLRSGMRLAYASGDSAQPPWVIDSVAHGLAFEGRSGCVGFLRRVAPAARATRRVLCASGDTLFAWDSAARAWQVDRPLGPSRRLVVRRPGRSVEFVTEAPEVAVVDGRRLSVLPTTVLTTDSAGRPLGRLRERYAVELATAVDGVFESPDATAPGGWRERQRFALRGVLEGEGR